MMKGGPILAGALGLLLSCSLASADKGKSEGTYTDAAGKSHSWQVTRSHALTWEGHLYAPAGVVFHSRYLLQPSEAAFAEDAAALARLSAAGTQDLWVDPGRGLLACPPEATRRLLDLLEKEGFRYGLAVRDRSTEPLTGCAPPMDAMPIPPVALQPGARFQWTARVRQARRAYYALVDPDQDWTIAAGTIPVENEIATIDITLKKTRLLGKNRGFLYLLPERQVEAEDSGSVPDLWQAMAAYQKRLTAYLKALRPGAGLRFIMDPFEAGGGLIGAESQIFPTSSEFRAAFGDWLAHRIGINEINVRWATTQTHLGSLETAGRLLPTWPREDPPDGTGWLVDPVEGKAYQVVARRCRIWDDYLEFRSDSLKRAMVQMAAAIHLGGPNVPVVFSWDGYQPLFTDLTSGVGYDGIAPRLSAHGEALARAGAAAALSQAEQSAMNWWLIAGRLSADEGRPTEDEGRRTETPAPSSVLRPPSPVRLAPTPGAAAPAAPTGLGADWATLRDLGYKGCYLDGGAQPVEEGRLAELKQLRATLAGDRELAAYLPKTCFFPALLPNSGRIARLPNGVWWLPSSSPARYLRLGDKMAGYLIQEPFGTDHPEVRSGVILWSPVGAQQATFSADQDSTFVILDSLGKPVKVKPKHGKFTLNLTESPLVAVGFKQDDLDLVFPMEATTSLIAEFDAMLKEAEAQKVDTSAARQLYNDAKAMLQPSSAAQVYQLVSRSVAALRSLLSPYQWIEGERPVEHNWDGSLFQDGASEGRYLQLDRQRPATGGVYQARYVVNIQKEATYQLWIAGRAPGQPGVSPLRWKMDSDPPVTLEQVEPVGGEYAPGFTWYTIGQVTLQKGRHVLTLEVPERAGGETGRYVFGIDALVLARAPFRPHGIERPNWAPEPSHAGQDVAARP
jgi:hypothetical protein